jgi:hypothetical protein
LRPFQDGVGVYQAGSSFTGLVQATLVGDEERNTVPIMRLFSRTEKLSAKSASLYQMVLVAMITI